MCFRALPSLSFVGLGIWCVVVGHSAHPVTVYICLTCTTIPWHNGTVSCGVGFTTFALWSHGATLFTLPGHAFKTASTCFYHYLDMFLNLPEHAVVG